MSKKFFNERSNAVNAYVNRGLGVLELTCTRCQHVKYLASDAVMETTGSWCVTPTCVAWQRSAAAGGRECEHSVKVHLQPGDEADKFIAEHNLNRPPFFGQPPRPWEMVTS